MAHPRERGRQLLAQAEELLKKRKLQEALDCAMSAHRLGFSEGLFLGASIYHAARQNTDASRLLAQYLKERPDDLSARLFQTELLHAQKRPRLTAQALKEATLCAQKQRALPEEQRARLRELYETTARPLPSWLSPTTPLTTPPRTEPAEEPLPTLAPVELPALSVRFSVQEGALPSFQQGPYHNLRAYQLRLEAEELSLVEGYDELLCIPTLQGVEEMWHQVEASRKVLRQMRGTALMADEVGLGKTIEASMILKELLLRGMARRVLILSPPALVSQWQGELSAKFSLSFQTTEEAKGKNPEEFWKDSEKVVASLALARRPPHKDILQSLEHDLVIVDEAHHLKNRQSASWKLVDSLKRRFLLLLTATPVENDLDELYNLITLLRPGQLGTPAQFRERFVKKGDPRTPLDRERLRGLLREVMVRNTRAGVGLKLPPRQASTVAVEPSPEEEALYQEVTALVREAYPLARQVKSFEDAPDLLSLQILLAEAGSSAPAVLGTLEKLIARPWILPMRRKLSKLKARAEEVSRSTKVERLLSIVRAAREPILCFTQFRQTLALIESTLSAAGIRVASFHGGLSSAQKDESCARFLSGECQVLLSTEVGGEGKNLQRACAHLVNFDLPWNPMRIEQRIGRLHRIGQTKTVRITTLVSKGSVEERVLGVLHEKINLFELVVGEVDLILGRLASERDFAEEVMARWAEARDEEEAAQSFFALGEELAQARRAQLESQKLDETIFGHDYES